MTGEAFIDGFSGSATRFRIHPREAPNSKRHDWLPVLAAAAEAIGTLPATLHENPCLPAVCALALARPHMDKLRSSDQGLRVFA
jgi:hypothetical protein